jgi:hypothetical protein
LGWSAFKAPSEVLQLLVGLFVLANGMLKPLDNESQTEFAVRFHTEMAESMPDTVKRNQACFDAWNTSRGDDPTIQEIATARFTPDKYQRLDNVALFHEHSVPAQDIDGKQLPAQHYGRDELAEMVEGMNERILDHDEFSPITRGHTGRKPGAADGERQLPEVLGFAGPYRLGMIGRKNPRWAIFGTEYHLKEAVPELRKRVGRSPEVWRYARMRNRFFYPIASLGEEMPRLNLPPAHYSRRSPDSEPVFVECYQATFPGGANTFAPSFNPTTDGRKPMADSYSAGAGASGSSVAGSDQLVKEIIEALFETQPFQFIFGLMRQAGQSGSTNPEVSPQIPPQESAMTANPTAGQGQIAGGGPPAAAAPSMPAPKPALGPAPAPQPPLGGGAPSVPPSPSGDRDKYSRNPADVDAMDEMQAENADLKSQLETALAQISELTKQKTRVERYSRLNDLARSYSMDPEEELERVENYSADQFDAHLEIIRDRYSRTITAIPDFSTLADSSDTSGASGPKKSSKHIDEKDVVAIEKYCIEHDCSFLEGKEVYLRTRESATQSV